MNKFGRSKRSIINLISMTQGSESLKVRIGIRDNYS